MQNEVATKTANQVANWIPPETAPLIEASKAPNTLRVYKSALAKLDAWLTGRELSDETLAAYLGKLDADEKSSATASLAVAAAKWRAGWLQQPSPEGKLTNAALAGYRRTAQDRGRGQAKAITAEQVNEVIGVAKKENRLADAAITALLFMGALRRSEVAALEWRDIEPAADVEGGLLVHVRTSKANKEGKPDYRLVKNDGAAALIAIKPAKVEGNVKIFGCNGQTIGRRFTKACAAAGIEGVTAHSGRRGHASELIQRGASTTEVMHSGGWESPTMVSHYSVGVRTSAGAVAKYL